jgi:hypothetical protein
MFAEAFHSMIKGIHLALEVKTSFSIYMPATSSSTESSTYKPRLPLTAVIGIFEKKRGTYTQKLQSKD